MTPTDGCVRVFGEVTKLPCVWRRWSVPAVDPLTAHECGNQRYLAIPWLDACLTARLPKAGGDPLKAMPADGPQVPAI